jgi:hypothetical protein
MFRRLYSRFWQRNAGSPTASAGRTNVLVNPADLAILESICLEASRWCEGGEARRDHLRTPQLRPDLGQWPNARDFHAAVDAVVVKRRALLQQHAAVEPARGKLLVCELNESINSGESKHASDGFFDLGDRPAWDTWVASVPWPPDSERVTLISFVPDRLIGLVTAGIDTNPYECIYWLSDHPDRLADWPPAGALAAEA